MSAPGRSEGTFVDQLQALPRDAALPQLARALDATAMADVFAGLLPHLHVAGCAVERVKYRPGRNASILYRLQLVDRPGQRDFEQRVATRLCTAGQSRANCHEKYCQ